jgi:hypothetical protein
MAPSNLHLLSVRGAALLVAALTLVVLGSACGDALPSQNPGGASEDGTAPVEARARDARFELVLRLPRLTWAAGEPIETEARLTYLGPADRIEISGSGSGLVLFGLESVEGPVRLLGAATADCVPRTIERNVPVVVPYRKSGGFSDDDPNAAWYRAFFADPLLRLSAGSWRLSATADGYLGRGCEGRRYHLLVVAELRVEG